VNKKKFSTLPTASKNKVADEKKLVKSGKFEIFEIFKAFTMDVKVFQSGL
jgi:hypothetical protein